MTQDLIAPGDSFPLFRRSIETHEIAKYLAEMVQGETVTYAELSKIAGTEITGTSHQLRSAREIVMRERGIVVEPIYGVGMKRLKNVEIVNAASRGVQRISKQAKREADKLANTDFEALDAASQRAYLTYASICEAVNVMSSNKAVAKISSHVNMDTSLTIAQTMKLFLGNE